MVRDTTQQQHACARVEAMITIRHTHIDGTLVEGTQRGGPENDVLKRNGFRWMPSIKFWGLRGSRDHPARRYVIEQTAEALRKVGIECSVDIDDTPRDTAEREADYSDRIEHRQEALSEKADKLEAIGDALYKQGTQMLDQIPMGQPILVGHYSERRDRNYRDRAGRKIDKGIQNWNGGRVAEGKADASARHQQYRLSGPVTQRRIDRLEAELRQVDRHIQTARDRQLIHVLAERPASNPWGNVPVARPAVPTVNPCGRCFYPLRGHYSGKRSHALLESEKSEDWAQVTEGPMCRDGWLSTDQVPVQDVYCGCCCCRGTVSGRLCREHDVAPQYTSQTEEAEKAREWEKDLLQRREALAGEITYWREHLADLEAHGAYTIPDPARYRAGDQVVTVFGPATVVRANPKTLTVTMPPPQVPGNHHISYEQVKKS